MRFEDAYKLDADIRTKLNDLGFYTNGDRENGAPVYVNPIVPGLVIRVAPAGRENGILGEPKIVAEQMCGGEWLPRVTLKASQFLTDSRSLEALVTPSAGQGFPAPKPF